MDSKVLQRTKQITLEDGPQTLSLILHKFSAAEYLIKVDQIVSLFAHGSDTNLDLVASFVNTVAQTGEASIMEAENIDTLLSGLGNIFMKALAPGMHELRMKLIDELLGFVSQDIKSRDQHAQDVQPRLTIDSLDNILASYNTIYKIVWEVLKFNIPFLDSVLTSPSNSFSTLNGVGASNQQVSIQ